MPDYTSQNTPECSRMKAFVKRKSAYSQTWRRLSPGLHYGWTSALAEVCVPYVLYFFHIFVNWYISASKGILQNLPKTFTQRCVLCVLIFSLLKRI